MSSLHDAIEACLETVKCDVCRSALDIVTRKVDSYLDLTVSVVPCEDCLQAAVERGRKEEK